ncbi:MAG: choice-of-anchor D domain-containing protein [Candidatus Kapaibacterium sp.]
MSANHSYDAVKRNTPILLFSCVLILANLLFASSSHALPRKHTIAFGGMYGFHYSPDYLEVLVGDTIEWIGDFSAYPLQSTTIPAGAGSFVADSIPSFQYIVRFQGEYDYENPVYYSIGMKGTIIVDTVKHGLTNEGREFYLGTPVPFIKKVYTMVYAMINSYYDNKVSLSYYDSIGHESTPVEYSVSSQGYLQIPLDTSKMSMDTTVEQPAYRTCHIISKLPITVEYLLFSLISESYLSLPVISLGRKYVVASFNDNPPSNASGMFMIIATEDGTLVQITPTTRTRGGHPGVFTGAGATGKPQPYLIKLFKGQCYLVRSNGHDDGNDISGTTILASSPIVVISGHEQANVGGILAGAEPNCLLEQLLPYEYWDSTGFISIPFYEPTPPADEGSGDLYRIYTYDSGSANTHLNVVGISDGYDFSTGRFQVPEKFDISGAVEAIPSNGQKISVIQYDEKMQSSSKPYQAPAPCMMTIIPRSRWKKYYSFLTYGSWNYLNILSSHLDDIEIAFNGTPYTPILHLPHSSPYGGISRADNSLFGEQCTLLTHVISDKPFKSFVRSEYPFMLYTYGIMNAGYGQSEYAAPAGMQLNTGVLPSFKIMIDSSNCTSWHFCVSDTSKSDPGIKSVMLIDDPDGVYFEPGEQLSNVSFDTAITYMPNELRPQGAKQYCFDVNILNPLLDAIAPVAIVDNGGNAVLLNLQKSAQLVKLSTDPQTLSRPDSIVFPVKKIGDQICTTFVFKNTAKLGGTALNLTSVSFTNSDPSYSIQSVTPSLPHSLAAQDSLTLQVCYTSIDSARHRDSLILKTDCFSFPISLDAHGSTGLISAADQDFGAVTAGDTVCRNILIKNVGSASFTLTKSFVLSDSINFTVDTSKLPRQIKQGGSASISICFHPKTEGSYSAGIDWGTDLEASFAHSVKSHSVLAGTAAPKERVKTSSGISSFSIHPNPSTGRSIIVRFPFGGTVNAMLSMFDVLGREVYHTEIFPDKPQVEIPISNLPEGVYSVQINSPSGSISQKFVKLQ